MLSKDFSEQEFACKCCGKVRVNQHFLDLLQGFRDYVGKPITITSGCRCRQHNISLYKQIYGDKWADYVTYNSAHIFDEEEGIETTGADIFIPGITLAQLWLSLERYPLRFNGMGSYPGSPPEVVHIDILPRFSRWVRRNGVYVYIF